MICTPLPCERKLGQNMFPHVSPLWWASHCLSCRSPIAAFLQLPTSQDCEEFRRHPLRPADPRLNIWKKTPCNIQNSFSLNFLHWHYCHRSPEMVHPTTQGALNICSLCCLTCVSSDMWLFKPGTIMYHKAEMQSYFKFVWKWFDISPNFLKYRICKKILVIPSFEVHEVPSVELRLRRVFVGMQPQCRTTDHLRVFLEEWNLSLHLWDFAPQSTTFERLGCRTRR